MTAVVRAVWATVPQPRVLVTVGAVDELGGRPGHGGRSGWRAGATRGPVRTRRSCHWMQADDASLATSGRKASVPTPPAPVMAGLADSDRDGLALDALHVALGPVLPHWPTGLVVHATLAGDLVTDARAEVLDVPGPRERPGGRRAPLGPDRTRLDALVRVLGPRRRRPRRRPGPRPARRRPRPGRAARLRPPARPVPHPRLDACAASRSRPPTTSRCRRTPSRPASGRSPPGWAAASPRRSGPRRTARPPRSSGSSSAPPGSPSPRWTPTPRLGAGPVDALSPAAADHHAHAHHEHHG